MLSIQLDLNVDSWVRLESQSATLERSGQSIVFEEVLESMFAFINSFILQNHHNQLVVSCYGGNQP